LLRRPPLLTLPAAALLATCLFPVSARFGELVQYLYPVRGEVAEQLKSFRELFAHSPSIWVLLMLMAAMPAVCEELACRGFILSGLRHIGHKWWAIAISSAFFGIYHPIFQQSLVAATVGMLIGYVAVQSGSIFPAMLFHLIHNSLTVLSGALSPKELGYNPLPEWFAGAVDGAYEFSWAATAIGAALSIAILAWFRNRPYARTAEEALQDALEHQSSAAHVAAS
jgi:sodium transport system permease protein